MMKRALYPGLLMISFILIFLSCQKEVRYDFTQDAQGSLVKDANGNCLPMAVSGNFVKGRNLADTNFIQVRVNITKTGRFIISSDTQNGYFFKAAGIFNNTGDQLVKLPGFGKPLSAGDDFFNIKFNNSLCKQDITVKDSTATVKSAVYTLQGSPGNCMNDSLTGNYIKGITLDTSNKLLVKVNVTTPGTYSINTITVNGYQFTGSGLFSATGLQQVTLRGTGTPQDIGVNIFSVSTGTSSCTFPVKVIQVIKVTANDYFPLTINSYWVYDNLRQAGDSIKRIIIDTSLKNGINYAFMDERPAAGSDLFHYFRKSGADYFEYGPVDRYTNSVFFTPEVDSEIYFLKGNLSTGDSWKSAEFQGAIQGGQQIKMQYVYTCINANATVSVNGLAFSNVYIISMKVQVRALTGNYSYTGEDYTYEYAKGVGLIYVQKSLFGFRQSEFGIRNYMVY